MAGNNYNLIENSSAAVPVSATGIDGSSTGGLVGYNQVGGLIQNCHASGTSYATEYFAGGLVGSNFGTINNSYATGNVSGYVYDGGLVGVLGGSGIIEYSYATGTATSQANVGGLVGSSGGLIEYCYATGAVSGASGQAGGLVGILGSGVGPGTIEDSYASGNVTGGYELGGLVGESYPGTIETSYATGSVTATDSTSVVGGLVGYTGGFYNGVTTVPGYVTDCYALGTVNGTYFVGGLAGENGPGGTVATSYAAGKVVGLGIAGGLTGYNAGTQTNNYWDKTVASGVTYGNGLESATPGNTGATPETTAAMMTQSTFTGFSFPSTWGIQEGVTRPYLFFQPVISGKATNGGSPVSGLPVNLVENGALLATTTTVASGAYAKVFNPGDVPANTGILALSGAPATLAASSFGVTSGGLGSLSGLDLNANTLTINSPTAGASNSALATALGSFASGGNVFTTGAGNSLTLNSGISLLTTAGTNYTIDGNLGVALGDLNATFNGPVNTGTSPVAVGAGHGNVNFANTLSLGGALNVVTTGGITLSGNVLNNNHNLTLSGPVTTTGGITIGNIGNINAPGDTGNTVTFADALTLGGNLTAIGGNVVLSNGLSGSSYNLTLRATNGAATLSGAIIASNILITASGASGNIVLGSGATVTAMEGTSQDLILAAADAFQNDAGSAALNPNGGTWLVYSNNPDIDTFGSLNSSNQAIWNQPYTSINPALSGDRYLFTNQPTLTASSKDDSKFYGQVADLSADYVVTGFVNAATYGNVFTQDTTANSLTGAFTLTSPGSVATATVAGSTYPITIAQGTAAPLNGYALTLSSPGKLTVNPLGVSVTISDVTSIYGTNPDLSGVTLTSGSTFANGQSISILGLVTSTLIDHNTDVGTYLNAITATSSNSNYHVTYTGGTITVNPLGVNVTVGNATSIYGTNPDLSGVTFNSASSFANGQSISILGLVASTTKDHNTNVGTYVGAITASSSNNNYTVTYTNGTLTVTPLGVNVTVGNATSTYGTNPDVSAVTFTSGSTFANGQTVADLGLVAATTKDHNTDVGTYVGAITATASNGNYHITYTDGTLTVNPLGVNITVGNATSTYGTNPDVSGVGFTSASTFANGQSISDLGLVAATTKDHNTDVGTYLGAITASSSNNNYAITYTNGTLTVNPLGINVTVGNATSTYGTNPDLSGVTFTSGSSFANGQTVADLGLVAATTKDHNTDVGTYLGAITASSSNNNYAITYTNGTLTVNPLGINVTVGNATSTYGTNPDLSGVTFTSGSSFANGQTVADLGLVAATTKDHNTDVGTYVGAITATSSNGNYAITYTDGTLKVNPLGVNVTVGNATSTYGTNPDVSGVTFTSGSSFANGQTVADLGLVAATTKDHNTDVGTYVGAITATSSNGNYAITYTDGTLKVNPLAVNVMVGNATSTYGSNPDLSGVTFTSGSSFANGQSVNDLHLVASTTASASTNAGSYANMITASSSNNNYTVSYNDGTLTVNKALLSFKVNDSIKHAGDPNPAFTGTWSGFVLGQQPNVLGGALVYATAANDSSPVGNYTVVASGLTSPNYDMSYTPGTLSVLSQLEIQNVTSQQDYALFTDEVRFSPKASAGKGALRYEGKGWNVGPSLAHGSSWSLNR